MTAGGAVVLLSLPGGHLERTLLRSGALGDELAVDPGARNVYVAVRSGCYGEVESLPIAGGAPRPVMAGTEPALSPDGSELAAAHEPALTASCTPKGNPATAFTVVLRHLPSATERSFSADPKITASGLPDPVTHLSWSKDGRRLLVTSPSVEDNEGWKLVSFTPAHDRYWLSASRPLVPIAGSNAGWYASEGIFAGGGMLVLARQCCSGLRTGGSTPSHVQLDLTSASTGTVLKELASVDPERAVSSLAADPSGRDLLYLAGGELYVDLAGKPTATATAKGLVAAAFLVPSGSA